MTKCERPVSDIIREVIEKTGMDKRLLKVPVLRKIKPSLVDAWKYARQQVDANIFIKSWNEYKEQSTVQAYDCSVEIKNKEITRNDINNNLKITEQKMVHELNSYSGCITTGIYRGREYKHFTTTKQSGKQELKEFILSEIFKNKSENNAWFDKFYRETMMEQEA